MKIDGIDVSMYGIRQWNVTPDYSEISNESEWITGAPGPLMLAGKAGFKKLKVSVVICGRSRREIWEQGSSFIAQLLTPRELQLDGFAHSFFVYLKNASQAETSLNRYHKATLELIGYEHGEEITASTTSRTLIVNNTGNVRTPAVVEIVPVINLASVALTGLVRDERTGADKRIIISDLINGKRIVIDGEAGLVTEDGRNKFKDVEMWDFPALVPGTNTITADKDIRLNLRYKPRYF